MENLIAELKNQTQDLKELYIEKIKDFARRLNVNFETIATDGNKAVRCFTILAWGEIQKPHYRYLIK